MGFCSSQCEFVTLKVSCIIEGSGNSDARQVLIADIK